ncbi:MAG: hypothetical protein ACYSSP_10250 [Planctomycetota bacterium]|jgi:hypothetical protein
MDKEKFEQLFHQLKESGTESSRPELSSRIKEHIPTPMPHHRGLDTINIMIDLRISRLAAAAAIIVTVLIFANFMGGGGSKIDNLYQDGKMLIEYWFGGKEAQNTIFQDSSELLKRLVPENKEDVEYFGDVVKPGDSKAVLMYWKREDGRYEVIFGDFKIRTLTADELLKAQGDMLKGKANK